MGRERERGVITDAPFPLLLLAIKTPFINLSGFLLPRLFSIFFERQQKGGGDLSKMQQCQ